MVPTIDKSKLKKLIDKYMMCSRQGDTNYTNAIDDTFYCLTGYTLETLLKRHENGTLNSIKKNSIMTKIKNLEEINTELRESYWDLKHRKWTTY